MANEYLVNSDDLTAVADAIRAKGGTSNALAFPDGFVSAVEGISAGGFPNGTEWTIGKQYVSKYTKMLKHNGLFVSISESNIKGVYYSEDGINFTKSNINDVGYELYFIKEKWFVLTSSGAYYSEDGKTWTISNVTSSLYKYHIIQYKNILILYGTNTGGTIYYSSDGDEWTAVTDYTYFSSCLSTDSLVVAGYFGVLVYSTDGITWSKSNITSGVGSVYNICYSNGMFIADTANKGIYYSTDGITWTNSDLNGTNSSSSNSLSYSKGTWFVSRGTNGLRYSKDGATWQSADMGGISGYTCAAPIYADTLGLFVVRTSDGVYYSTDGVVWTKSNLDSSVNSIVYDNGIWLATKDSKGVYYSTDGKTWNLSNLTTDSAGSEIAKPVYYDGVWYTCAGVSFFNAYYSVGWKP